MLVFLFIFQFSFITSVVILYVEFDYSYPHLLNSNFFVSFPQNELIFTDILRLSVNVSASEDQDGGQQVSLDGKFMVFTYQISDQSSSCFNNVFIMWVMFLCIVSGTSFDFHKQTDHLFLVGTEDGKIHKVCVKSAGLTILHTQQFNVAINEKDKHKCVLRKSFL